MSGATGRVATFVLPGVGMEEIEGALENCLRSDLTSVAVVMPSRRIALECHLAHRYVPRFRDAGGALALVRGAAGLGSAGQGDADAILAGLDELPHDLDAILVLLPQCTCRADYRAAIVRHLASGDGVTVGSMGVYIVRRDALAAARSVLSRTRGIDFARDVLPVLLQPAGLGLRAWEVPDACLRA